MSITGPELDLLQEVLAEDPAADIFMDVAQALFDSGEPRAAAEVLRRALDAGAEDDQAAHLLARAASASGDDAGVRAAAAALGPEAMRDDPVLARAWALALDRNGELDRAAKVASSLIEAHGPDPELGAIVERQQAAPPDARSRGRDPYYTASRAEAYLENGRPDLALRVYRRILSANPSDQAIHARLLRLRAMPKESRPWVDDLSEEYWLNRPAPPLDMPVPALVPQDALPPDEETTIPGAPMRISSGQPPLRVAPGMPGTPGHVGRVPQLSSGAASFANDDEDDVATVVAPWVDTTDSPDDEPTVRPTMPVVDQYAGSNLEMTDMSGFDDGADSFDAQTNAPQASPFMDDDEDATEVRTLSEIRALSQLQAQSRSRSAPEPKLGGTPRPPPNIGGSFSDFDEEATEITGVDEMDDATERRTLPGADDLRRALAEAEYEDESPSLDDGDDSDTDSIIEQARAIERAAARRRTLFRK